jgi:hypothetical protein
VRSADERKRIAATQKARWAAFHAGKAAAPEQKAKRRISAERKAALATNLAKARAAKAAKAARDGVERVAQEGALAVLALELPARGCSAPVDGSPTLSDGLVARFVTAGRT